MGPNGLMAEHSSTARTSRREGGLGRISSRTAIAAVAVFVIIAAINLPRFFIDVFGIRTLQLGTTLPYLAPAALVLAYWMSRFTSDPGRWTWPLQPSDLWFLASLSVWAVVEAYYGLMTGQWRTDMILANLWFLLFLHMLLLLQRMDQMRSYFVPVALGTFTAIGLFDLLLLALLEMPSIGIDRILVRSELESRNGVSFLAVFAVLLCLFYSDMSNWKRRLWNWGALIPVNASVIIANQTRGALLLLLVLVGTKILFIIFDILRGRKFFVAGLVILTLASLLALSNSASVRNTANQVFSGLDFSPLKHDDVLYALPNDQGSTYSRNKGNILVLQAAAERPLFGTGLAQLMDIRVYGYVPHSYLFYPLGAYGLMGTLPYIWFFALWFKRGWQISRRSTFAAILLLVGAMTFTNDMLGWYAVLLFIVGYCTLAKTEPT